MGTLPAERSRVMHGSPEDSCLLSAALIGPLIRNVLLAWVPETPGRAVVARALQSTFSRAADGSGRREAELRWGGGNERRLFASMQYREGDGNMGRSRQGGTHPHLSQMWSTRP